MKGQAALLLEKLIRIFFEVVLAEVEVWDDEVVVTLRDI